MAFPRSSISSITFARQSRAATRTGARTWLSGQIGRRGYASGGHAPKKASSDLPWLIGSIAVTVPTCAYILQPKQKSDHGQGHNDDHHEEDSTSEEHSLAEHDETVPESSGEQSQEEGSESHEHAAPTETQDSDVQQESSTDSDSDDEESRSVETPNTSEDESEDRAEHSDSLPKFKGPRKDGPAPDNRMDLPGKADAGTRRINSAYSHSQGLPDKGGFSEDESGSLKDEASSSKEPLSQNYMSGKQDGRSNADTKFSKDLSKMSNIPKKGEGDPESSKSKGTINPSRPQPEQREGRKGQED